MKSENRAGLELAIIFHLVVILVLLCAGISNVSKNEQIFVLDFTKQEELERKIKELEKQIEQEKKKAEVNKSIDELIEKKKQETNVRNVAVNTKLRDDRHSDKEMKELNDKAGKLQQDLKDKSRQKQQSDPEEVQASTNQAQNTPKQDIPVYRGKSTVCYTLDSRQGVKLTVPAYQCIGGGEVTVIITVNRSGSVIEARIDDALSDRDESMRKAALNAAKTSRFDLSQSAPERQRGTITYIFIPQNSR